MDYKVSLLPARLPACLSRKTIPFSDPLVPGLLNQRQDQVMTE